MKNLVITLTSFRWRVGLVRAGWTVACLTSVLLAACAGNGVGGSHPEDAPVTPSLVSGEQTDVRRRAQIRLELAANYFDAGQDKVALEEVQQALALDPQSADAFNLHALLHMRLGNFAEADASFRRARSLRPADPDTAHNHAWLLCQNRRYAQAQTLFSEALNKPNYRAKAKTWMAQGVCWADEGRLPEAEKALLKAYEFDTTNPVIAYQLALTLYRLQDYPRAQFYIRRVNNGEFSNAESLFLGIKVESALGNTVSVQQLAGQLKKRFPDSREWMDVERGKIHD